MLTPLLAKNDRKAQIIIGTVSVIVFVAVIVLGKLTLAVDLPFNPRVFATINAYINTTVAILLLAALLAVKQKKYTLHRNIMLVAIVLSVLFLLTYIAHHLFTEPTQYGGTGIGKTIYYLILFTHIPLAGVVLPLILFSAYRALIGEYNQHKKLTRITYPLWLYVAVTGVVVYYMIKDYYVA